MGGVACIVESAFGEHAEIYDVFENDDGPHVEDSQEEGQEHFLPEDAEGEEVVDVGHHIDGGKEGEEGEALFLFLCVWVVW